VLPINLDFTDPTYLRSIRDGLISGTLHRNNAASLPYGLSGIYEQALPSSDSPAERQRFLEFFGVWALLKKEVSAGFVASLLHGWTETAVIENINRFSNWFNAASPGKFVLYHHRFQTFILSKLSQKHLIGLQRDIVEWLNNEFVTDKESEIRQYRAEYFIHHLALLAFYDTRSLSLLKSTISNRKFLDFLNDSRISTLAYTENLHLCIDLAVYFNDRELLQQIGNSVAQFYDVKLLQIFRDLSNPFTPFGFLLDHFQSKGDAEDRIRLFFLICSADRDFNDSIFDELIRQSLNHVQDEYFELREMAPEWLFVKVQNLQILKPQLVEFFDEIDEDESSFDDELETGFFYIIENLTDYPGSYQAAYHIVVNQLINDKSFDSLDFQNLFDSIPGANLMNRDEILTRITSFLLSEHFRHPNTKAWFFWLLSSSAYESGHHSPGRENAYRLCLEYAARADVPALSDFIGKLDGIAQDYHDKIKIINFVSQQFYNYGDYESARETLFSPVSDVKGEKFRSSSWIKSWIQKKPTERIRYSDKMNLIHQIEVHFHHFLATSEGLSEDCQNAVFYKAVQQLDLVSKAEFLADLSIVASAKNHEISKLLIMEAWQLVQSPDDWAEFFASISVFCASFDSMPSDWILRNFPSFKKNILKFSDGEVEPETHLEETLFSIVPGRFSASGRFQVIKDQYPPIFKFLKKEFGEFCDKAEEQLVFVQVLEAKLNGYANFRSFWNENKNFFSKGHAGEDFKSFWTYLADDSGIFSRFNSDDFKSVELIANRVNRRFPWEKFIHLNAGIQFYAARFSIPDNFDLGENEGFSSLAKYKNYIEFDGGFRTVLGGALHREYDALLATDWLLDPIQAEAFCLKKVLPFSHDVIHLLEYMKMAEDLRMLD
jgi:hypothetical protein